MCKAFSKLEIRSCIFYHHFGLKPRVSFSYSVVNKHIQRPLVDRGLFLVCSQPCCTFIYNLFLIILYLDYVCTI